MIPLACRAHVVDWKKVVHPFWGRKPTEEEWSQFQLEDVRRRFTAGEEIADGILFAGYGKRRTSGMQCMTPEQFAKRKTYQYRHYVKNREKISNRKREYDRKNREACNAYRRAASAETKRKRVAYQAAWRKRNRDKANGYRRKAYHKRKPIPSAERRITVLIRDRLRVAVARKLYGRHVDKPSVNFLIWLAERDKIDWKLGYQIDHIVPLSRLDLTLAEGQMLANAPENVRWMQREDNASRGNSMPSQSEIDAHLVLVALWRESIK